jgi:peptide deformylase
MGRAIAAPQIGVLKRVVYMHITDPVVFLNPKLEQKSREMIKVWDNCMSFPDLRVQVVRHRACTVAYRDLNWKRHVMHLTGDLSELLQHECDHLDGVLAVARAVDERSFTLDSNPEREEGEAQGP